MIYFGSHLLSERLGFSGWRWGRRKCSSRRSGFLERADQEGGLGFSRDHVEACWAPGEKVKETGQVPGRPKWASDLQAGCGNPREALEVSELRNEEWLEGDVRSVGGEGKRLW